jgi:hypothetical protein
MDARIEMLNDWCRFYLPDFTDLRTEFESGRNLIRLLQVLKPGRAPTGPYNPDPQTSFEKRRTRDVAVRFAKELGARGDFTGAVLDPHTDLYSVVQLIEAIIVGVARVKRSRIGDPPPRVPSPRESPPPPTPVSRSFVRSQFYAVSRPFTPARGSPRPLTRTVRALQHCAPMPRKDFAKLEELRKRDTLYARLNDSVILRMRVMNAALDDATQRESAARDELSEKIELAIERVANAIQWDESEEQIEKRLDAATEKVDELKGFEEFLLGCNFALEEKWRQHADRLANLRRKIEEGRRKNEPS